MNDKRTPKSRKGQWHKGVSGNPAGRPPGSRNRATVALEVLLEEGAEPLINKAMAMALSGDTAALRLCLERILPVRRDRFVRLDFPAIATAKDVSIGMSTIIMAVAQGQITPGEGEMMANVVAKQTNILMSQELESRLEKVEAALLAPEKTKG